MFTPAPRPRSDPHGIGPVVRIAMTASRGWLVIAAATLLASFVAVLQPWPLQVLIDSVFGPSPMPPWLPADRPTAVVVLAASQIVLVAVDLAIVAALSHWWITTGQRLVYDLTRRLFANAQRRSPLYHATTSVGDLISRITGDSWSIYGLATALVFTPIHAVVMTGLMTAVLWHHNPMLTLVSLAVAPGLAVGAVVLGRFTHGAARDQRESEARIESHVHQTLSGIPVVQTFAQEDRQHKLFVDIAGQAVSAQRRAAVISGVSGLFSGTLSAVGAAVVLYVGCRQVLAGRLTTGQLLVFLAYLGALHGELLTLAHTWIGNQGTFAGVARIHDLLTTRPEVLDPPDPIRFPESPAGCHVEFRDVWFGYDPGRPVLRGITFDARPGQTVAVVGESGAGKSTLAALTSRLFDPDRGRILIDGIDLRFFALPDLRRHVVAASQEPLLTAGTVADNISFGLIDADVKAAAAVAAADGFIDRLDSGYDTELGESGVTLSGGERQRLSIARAVARNSPVLVLDEPSSALDSVTEQSLFDRLPRQRTRTTILITHRLSTARSADRILFLARGRIIEAGTHDQLLAIDGQYAKLYHLRTTAGRRATQGVS